MGDSYTEVSSQGWFSRIGGAIKGVIFGILLFLIAFPVLFWNEGRSVKRYQALKEGAGAVISVSIDKVDDKNEGKLIHVSGKTETSAKLTDPTFGISANAIKLERKVEMYQWKESKKSRSNKKVGGSKKTETTYTYKKGWHSKHISSSKFKVTQDHKNPEKMPYSKETWAAKDVKLGAFALSRSLISQLSNYETLPVQSGASIPVELQSRAKVHDTKFYIGNNPAEPQVGDCRVSFKVVNTGDISVISKQVKNSFEAYTTSGGGSIELLQDGIVSAKSMFQKAQDANTMMTWGLRFLGFILMMIGLSMVFKPLSVLADVVPILGSIVGAGTGMIAFLLAGFFSFLTISIAWIFYRPLLGIGLIVIAFLFMAGVGGKLKSAKPVAATA